MSYITNNQDLLSRSINMENLCLEHQELKEYVMFEDSDDLSIRKHDPICKNCLSSINYQRKGKNEYRAKLFDTIILENKQKILQIRKNEFNISDINIARDSKVYLQQVQIALKEYFDIISTFDKEIFEKILIAENCFNKTELEEIKAFIQSIELTSDDSPNVRKIGKNEELKKKYVCLALFLVRFEGFNNSLHTMNLNGVSLNLKGVLERIFLLRRNLMTKIDDFLRMSLGGFYDYIFTLEKVPIDLYFKNKYLPEIDSYKKIDINTYPEYKQLAERIKTLESENFFLKGELERSKKNQNVTVVQAAKPDPNKENLILTLQNKVKQLESELHNAKLGYPIYEKKFLEYNDIIQIQNRRIAELEAELKSTDPTSAYKILLHERNELKKQLDIVVPERNEYKIELDFLKQNCSSRSEYEEKIRNYEKLLAGVVQPNNDTNIEQINNRENPNKLVSAGKNSGKNHSNDDQQEKLKSLIQENQLLKNQLNLHKNSNQTGDLKLRYDDLAEKYALLQAKMHDRNFVGDISDDGGKREKENSDLKQTIKQMQMDWNSILGDYESLLEDLKNQIAINDAYTNLMLELHVKIEKQNQSQGLMDTTIQEQIAILLHQKDKASRNTLGISAYTELLRNSIKETEELREKVENIEINRGPVNSNNSIKPKTPLVSANAPANSLIKINPVTVPIPTSIPNNNPTQKIISGGNQTPAKINLDELCKSVLAVNNLNKSIIVNNSNKNDNVFVNQDQVPKKYSDIFNNNVQYNRDISNNNPKTSGIY